MMGGPQSLEVLWSTPTAPERMVKCTTKASSAVMAAGRDVGQRGADPVELAEGAADLVDDLGAVGGHPPAALVGVGPPLGYLGRGVGEQRHVEQHGGHTGLADLAVPDGLGQQGLSGVPPELAPEQVDHAGRLGGGQDRPALGGVAGERLLADEVLAGGDGGQRDGRVGVGRGGDGDGVRPRRGPAPRRPRSGTGGCRTGRPGPPSCPGRGRRGRPRRTRPHAGRARG